MNHHIYLNTNLKIKNYIVRGVVVSCCAKEVDVHLSKRFGILFEEKVRKDLEQLGYYVNMMDSATVPGDVIVQCSYD